MLTPRYPFPENGGDIQRINKVASYLKSQGHTVILLAFYENESQLQVDLQNFDKVYIIKRRRLESFLYMLLFLLRGKPLQSGYYFSRRYMRKLKEIVCKERPDRYIAWLLRTTPYTDSLRLEPSTVMEMSDALSKTYSMSRKGKGSLVKKIAYEIERFLIGRYEADVIRRYPKVVLVSREDIKYLHGEVDGDSSSLAFHSLGVNCLPEIPTTIDINQKKICFVGNMRTLQNQDAVLRFVKDIFPRILERVPASTFYIVGAEPAPSIQKLASKNVVVTGFVDSVQDTIQDACISVAPIHVAAGLQNKVLASMACGVPVVMSSLVAKAIPELDNGNNCIICDDPMEFAESCIQLMTNPEKRQRIGFNSWQMVRENYSWPAQLQGYEEFDKNKL